MERLEAARDMRGCAARLRRIAETETHLSAELRKIADQIDKDAALIEKSFRDSPPQPANDENVA